MCIFLLACQEEELTPMAEKAEVYVNITLSVGGGMSSRATPDHNEEYVSMGGDETYEYSIDPYDVDILLFKKGTETNGGNGTFVERVTVTPFWFDQGTKDGDHVYYYQLQGSVSSLTKEDLNQNYQLMVIANMGSENNGWLHTTDLAGAIYNKSYAIDTTTTRDQFIEKLVYHNYNSDFTRKLMNGEARIPMWGIKEITMQKSNNFADVDMLRVMAKVRVTISDSLYNKGYRFTYAGMTSNTSGYIAAQNEQAVWENNGLLTTNYNNKTHTGIETPSIPTDTTAWRGFEKVIKHKSHVIYIPEYQNIEINEEGKYPTQIHVEIKDCNVDPTLEGEGIKFDGHVPYLYFAEYTSGKKVTENEWDIIRNDFYDYTITGIKAGKLEANVRVMPWDVDEMSYTLSQEQAVDIQHTATNYPAITYTDNNVSYEAIPAVYSYPYDAATSKYATFKVKISQPAGVKWMAHLTNPEFEFVTEEESGAVSSGYVDGKEVTIMVRPTKSYPTDGSIRTTQLYFTIETLLNGAKAQITVNQKGKEHTDIATETDGTWTYTEEGQAVKRGFALNEKWEQIRIVQSSGTGLLTE